MPKPKRLGRPATARVIAVGAAVQIGLGLGFYTFPQGFASPLDGLTRTLISSVITGSGIMLLMLLRYPVPTWARRLMVLPSVLVLAYGVTHTVDDGSTVRTIHDALLALTLLVSALLPPTGKDDEAPGHDLAVATLALMNILVSLALVRQWAFGVVALPELASWPPAAGLAGAAGLVGAAALIIPERGLLVRPQALPRRLAGAFLPLFIGVTLLVSRDLHGLLWLVWAVMVGTAKGRPVRLARLMKTREPAAPRSDQLVALDGHLELWTWLVALALLVWTALQGVDGRPPLGTEQFLVLSLVTYNLLVHWAWPKKGAPRRRVLTHVMFLTIVLGSLRLLARDSAVAHAFGALLLATPILATYGLGRVAGYEVLGLAIALVNASAVKGWLVDGTPMAAAIAGGAVETLALLLAGGVGVQNAEEQRRMVQDLTRQARELRRAEDTLRESEEKFRSAFAGAAIGKALIDPADGHFIAVNRALSEMLGYSEDQLLKMGDEALLHPDEKGGRFRLADLDPGISSCLSVERRYVNRQGQTVWAQVTASPALGADGRPQSLIVEYQDVTARRKAEDQLIHLASHDPLTNLFNRRRFRQDLEHQLQLADGNGSHGAVIFLDLDNFKEINDTLGHDVGDQVLVSVAGALRTRLRDTDTLARLGGDEFAILLPDASIEQAEAVAKKVLGTVAGQFIMAGGHLVRATASLGVAAYPEHGRAPEELLKRADIALFQAKEFRNCHAVYRPDSPLESLAIAQQIWEDRVRGALKDDRLLLHAQPILDLRTGRVSHHELLLRMLDQDGRLVPPAAFLGAAERSGLISEIDRWVVRRAIRLLAQLSQGDHGRARLDVNLSARAFTDSELIPLIQRELAETGIDPGLLVIEITETAAIANIEEARGFINRLKEMGFRFALDDFGTGYSSLAHLRNLPVDFIKIDGSFVQDIATNPVDRHLVAGIAGMARGMGIRTVAEFVGSDKALDIVKKLGVDFAQGFHIGVPEELSAAFGPAVAGSALGLRAHAAEAK